MNSLKSKTVMKELCVFSRALIIDNLKSKTVMKELRAFSRPCIHPALIMDNLKSQTFDERTSCIQPGLDRGANLHNLRPDQRRTEITFQTLCA